MLNKHSFYPESISLTQFGIMNISDYVFGLALGNVSAYFWNILYIDFLLLFQSVI